MSKNSRHRLRTRKCGEVQVVRLRIYSFYTRMPGRHSDIFSTLQCAYRVDGIVRVTPFLCSRGRPTATHNFFLELRRSVGEIGGFKNGVRGNFISRTETVRNAPTPWICRARMPDIPIGFTRTVAPTVSELGAPKVFRPVRYIAEGKKILLSDLWF